MVTAFAKDTALLKARLAISLVFFLTGFCAAAQNYPPPDDRQPRHQEQDEEGYPPPSRPHHLPPPPPGYYPPAYYPSPYYPPPPPQMRRKVCAPGGRCWHEYFDGVSKAALECESYGGVPVFLSQGPDQRPIFARCDRPRHH